MATTKTKSGRKAAAKGSSKSRSRTAKRATVPEGTGLDSKQQAALERGGSLAQRNSSESTIGPEADRPDQITSAAPPNDKTLAEAGRASSPMFDETAVTGKDQTGTKTGPRGQKVKAGAAGGENKVEDIKALEDLPPGSTVEFRPSEVVIGVAIAGGTRRTFIGRDAAQALAEFNDFAENGPKLFDGAAPGSEDPDTHEAMLKQFDKEALERSKADLKARGIEAD